MRQKFFNPIVLFTFFCTPQFSHSQTYRKSYDVIEKVAYAGSRASFRSNISYAIHSIASKFSQSYINMYEATKDKKYLDKFLVYSKKAKDRRDDFIVKHNNFYTSNEINTSAEFETFNCL